MARPRRLRDRGACSCRHDLGGMETRETENCKAETGNAHINSAVCNPQSAIQSSSYFLLCPSLLAGRDRARCGTVVQKPRTDHVAHASVDNPLATGPYRLS